MDQDSRALFRKIRITTRRKLDSLFIGEYRSAFRGYGLLFNSVREYQYGDDVRHIDWNVSARTRNLYVKEYIEERELSVMLMVDCSASVSFGSVRSKRDLVLETAMLLLYLARMNNDRLSVMLFTDKVEKYIAPRKGGRFTYAVFDELRGHRPRSRGTDIAKAVDFAGRVLKKRSIIFVISDFLDGDFESGLRRLSKRHDVIPVVVADPMERTIGFSGLVEFLDMETGRSFLSDTLPRERRLPAFRGLDAIYLRTDEPVETPMLRFFERRSRAYRARAR